MKKFGISLITDFKGQRSELAYISLRDINVQLQTMETQLQFQMKLGYMQIDNQLSYRVPYPVALQSLAVKKVVNKDDKKAPNKFNLLETTIIYRKNAAFYYFELIKCMLRTMDVKLDDEIISFVIKFASNVTKDLQTTVSSVHEIFQRKEDDQENLKLSKETAEQIQQLGQKIYIAKLDLSPIEIVFSFLKKMNSESDFMSEAGIISKAIGVALTNVEASIISFNAINVNQIFGSTVDVSAKIYSYYSDQFIKTAFKLIGSLDFIGNPVKIFNTLATGVKDFFYEPVTGCKQGPKEGAVGLFKGTKSLLKHTVIGTFGAVSEVASAWSKGFLMLSNDKKYISQREERFIKEKAETLVDGIGYGAHCCVKSIASGVMGVVKQPYKEAKRRGVRGFAKGMFFGALGTVVKPISGALDFIARSTEGGKNTAYIFDEDLESRVRDPRPFYTKLQIVLYSYYF